MESLGGDENQENNAPEPIIPTSGLVFYAPLSASALSAETGQSLTDESYGEITYVTDDNKHCAQWGQYGGTINIDPIFPTAQIDTGKSCTASVWVKVEPNRQDGNHFFCIAPGTSGNTGTGLFIGGNGTRWSVYSGGTYSIQAPSGSLSGWTHLCFTNDGTSIMMYENGQYVTSGAAWDIGQDGRNPYLGESTYSEESWIFKMMAVRLYDRVLTSGEIQGLYSEFAPAPDEIDIPLTFVAQSSGAAVKLEERGGTGPTVNLQYKTANSSWTSYTEGDIIPVNEGDYVQFKGDNSTFAYDPWSGRHSFVTSGTFALSGNVMSLLDSTLESRTISAEYALYGMFGGTGITRAPLLPASSLYDGAYFDIFNGCSGLLSGADLPATYVPRAAYQNMYWGCDHMTYGGHIYGTSFYGGADLGSMFRNCSMLSCVQVDFTQWDYDVSPDWMYGAGNGTGNFICPSSLDDQRGDSYIPYDWTKVDNE